MGWMGWVGYLLGPTLRAPDSANKCPKPSGQAFRPPQKTRICPFDLGQFFSKQVPKTVWASL